MDINNEQFVTILRSALHYLYDPDQLRRSPLASLLDVSNRVDASIALQKILIDSIQAIQPEENEPSPSRGWLLHDVLFFRYVRGYERQAVANQLGISERQLSRDQRAALETLAQYLWITYRLEDKNFSLPPGSQPVTGTPDTLQSTSLPDSSLSASTEDSGELSWIEELPADKPAAWKLTLLSLLDLLRPLVDQNEVLVDYEPDENLPDLLVPQNALRHSLLNILGLMIPLARQGRLTLVPSITGQELGLSAAIRSPEGTALPDVSFLFTHPNIKVAQQLLERVGGALHVADDPSRFKIDFTIPALAQIPVMVIDDNPDTIQLFQRYAQATRYSVVGSPGPSAFYSLLQTSHPRIILLDVMMPEMDGWDLLSQLRQDHQFNNTAIIICSILPQADLARSLGADGFLQKPVMPQDFIRALDEQMSQFGEDPKPGMSI